jgi:hypothetical protein
MITMSDGLTLTGQCAFEPLRLIVDAWYSSCVFQALFCPTGHRAFAIGFVITVGACISIAGHSAMTIGFAVPSPIHAKIVIGLKRANRNRA